MADISDPFDYINACKNMKLSLVEHLKLYEFINTKEIEKLIETTKGKCESNLQRKIVVKDTTTSQEYGYLISDLITPFTYTNVAGFESLQKTGTTIKPAILHTDFDTGQKWNTEINKQLQEICKKYKFKNNSLILSSEEYNYKKNPSKVVYDKTVFFKDKPNTINIGYGINLTEFLKAYIICIDEKQNFLGILKKDKKDNKDNIENIKKGTCNFNEFKIISNETKIIPPKMLNITSSEEKHMEIEKAVIDDGFKYKFTGIKNLFLQSKSRDVAGLKLGNLKKSTTDFKLNIMTINSSKNIFHSYYEHTVNNKTYYIINIHNDSGQNSKEAAEKIINFIDFFAEQIIILKGGNKEDVKKMIIIGGDSNVYYSTVNDEKFNTGLKTLYDSLKHTHTIFISKNIITKTRPCNFFMNAQTMTKSEVNVEETDNEID